MSAAGDVVDRLYGLPLEEFTAQRDLTARELRRAGDREAAAELAKLPKPTPAAWTANLIARDRPELVEALLDAGAALRDAQEQALAGGGGDVLRDAMAGQRRTIDAVMAAAQSYRPAGRALSRAMTDRLRTTLQAAAGDEALSAALAAGRLVDEAQSGGAWPLGPVPEGDEVVGRRAARREPDGDAAPADADRDDAAAREAAVRERAALEAAARERAALEAELRKVRGALRVRERAVAAAQEAAEHAVERLARARQEAEDAQAEAEAAEQGAAEAREALQAARDDVARLEERLD